MNPKAFIISLIFIQFAVHLPADAQIVLDPVVNPPLYNTEFIRADIGLSSPLILSLYEDRYGFIWIGTQYGLDKYDGYSVSRMSDVEYDGKKFSMEWIWSIQEDLQGILWVCSSRGLFRYDRSKNSFDMLLPNPEDPVSEDNQVLMTRQDSRGIHWVFTKGGLFSYNPEEELFTDYKKDSIVGREKYGGWYLLMKYNLERYLEDKSGNIWICTLNGLKRYDPDDDSFITHRHDPRNLQSISGNNTTSIKEDYFGNLWLRAALSFSQDVKLNRIMDAGEGIFKHYSYDPSNPKIEYNNWLYPIYIAKDSNLWIGGHNEFFRFDYQTDKLVRYQLSGEEYPRGRVWNVEEGPEGDLWMSRDGFGVSTFNPAYGKTYHFLFDENDPNNILPSNAVVVQPINNTGTIWILTESALSRSSPRVKPFHTIMTEEFFQGSENSRTISTVCFDSQGILWFGGGFGLNKIKDYNPAGKNEITSAIHSSTYCLLEDSQDQFWIGSMRNGLGRLDKSTNRVKWFGSQEHPDSLNSTYISSMHEDSRGLSGWKTVNPKVPPKHIQPSWDLWQLIS